MSLIKLDYNTPLEITRIDHNGNEIRYSATLKFVNGKNLVMVKIPPDDRGFSVPISSTIKYRLTYWYKQKTYTAEIKFVRKELRARDYLYVFKVISEVRANIKRAEDRLACHVTIVGKTLDSLTRQNVGVFSGVIRDISSLGCLLLLDDKISSTLIFHLRVKSATEHAKFVEAVVMHYKSRNCDHWYGLKFARQIDTGLFLHQ